MRLKRALDEYVIEGIETNIFHLRKLLTIKTLLDCNFDISQQV